MKLVPKNSKSRAKSNIVPTNKKAINIFFFVSMAVKTNGTKTRMDK